MSREFTKREHVIPQSFGRFAPDNLILHCVCDECNEFFGKYHDSYLARDSFEGLQRSEYGLKDVKSMVSDFIGNRLVMRLADNCEYIGLLLGVKVEEGKLAYAPIPQVGFAKAQQVGWKFMAEPELYEARSLPDGISLQKGILLIPDLDVPRLIRLLWRKGISFKEKNEVFPQPSNSGQIEIEGEYVVDRVIQRAVSKIALNYLAKIAGSDFVLSENFDSIRKFVRYGTLPDYKFFRVSQDPILREDSKIMRQTTGHLIVSEWSGSQNEIKVHFSLFNILTHEVVLTPNYSGMWRDIRTGHHFDITNRRISKLHNAIFVRPVRKILGRLV